MKGFTVGTIAELIIAIIVMVVVLPILFRAAGNVWDQLAESFGIVKYSPIERALICYYYLCRGGCSDPNFNDFCSPDKIGRENYEGACSLPASLGVEGGACSAAFQFPLKVELDSEAELSKASLKKKIDTTHVVIVTENTQGGVNWGEALKLAIPLYLFWDSYLQLAQTSTFLPIHTSYLTDVEEEGYTILTTTYSHTVKSSKVKKGVFYISGSVVSVWPFPPKYFIYTDDSPRYLNLTNGKTYDNLVIIAGQIVRMSVEDEKTDNLKDYNYLMNISVFPPIKNPSGFYIEFWNDPKSPNTIEKDCANQCSAEVTFNTKKGKIIVNVKKVEPVGCDIYTGLYCNFNITLSVAYTKTLTGGPR
jgi:hypothetical protein